MKLIVCEYESDKYLVLVDIDSNMPSIEIIKTYLEDVYRRFKKYKKDFGLDEYKF